MTKCRRDGDLSVNDRRNQRFARCSVAELTTATLWSFPSPITHTTVWSCAVSMAATTRATNRCKTIRQSDGFQMVAEWTLVQLGGLIHTKIQTSSYRILVKNIDRGKRGRLLHLDNAVINGCLKRSI